jgi:hypothetical protein
MRHPQLFELGAVAKGVDNYVVHLCVVKVLE